MNINGYKLIKWDFGAIPTPASFTFVISDPQGNRAFFDARPKDGDYNIHNFNLLTGAMDLLFTLQIKWDRDYTPEALVQKVFKNTINFLNTEYPDNMDVFVVDVGQKVICDNCNEDYTESEARGGLLFSSKAYCPVCAPKLEADAIKYGEERFIKARCAHDQSFKDFVLSIR